MQVVLQIVILDEIGFATSLLSTICELKGRKAKTNASTSEVEDARTRLAGLMRLSNRLKGSNLISDAVVPEKSSKFVYSPTLLSFHFFPYFFGESGRFPIVAPLTKK
jgi:hypothetical protein